jgi:hypothetical protein
MTMLKKFPNASFSKSLYRKNAYDRFSKIRSQYSVFRSGEKSIDNLKDDSVLSTNQGDHSVEIRVVENSIQTNSISKMQDSKLQDSLAGYSIQ